MGSRSFLLHHVDGWVWICWLPIEEAITPGCTVDDFLLMPWPPNTPSQIFMVKFGKAALRYITTPQCTIQRLAALLLFCGLKEVLWVMDIFHKWIFCGYFCEALYNILSYKAPSIETRPLNKIENITINYSNSSRFTFWIRLMFTIIALRCRLI